MLRKSDAAKLRVTTGVRAWGAERDGRADGKAAPAGAYGGGRQDNTPGCGGGRHGQDTG